MLNSSAGRLCLLQLTWTSSTFHYTCPPCRAHSLYSGASGTIQYKEKETESQKIEGGQEDVNFAYQCIVRVSLNSIYAI
ncbi:hypothetical protein SeMB42_g02846 [Synchytrium endobioticum]|uniref:Uncharacterized protein n=1 Tax=Synchytrium endobioticum TaxID=286115 RepID=A0A507DB92_9FUNG|nr:hypothetical protein SeMB42_g02846 [Synchytrium endobioticum]